MRQLSYWAARCGHALRAAAIAVDPGEDDESLDECFLLDCLDQELRRDFAHAALALTRARRRQRVTDTPMHRHAVLASAARVNAVLDMYLLHLEIQRDLPAATRA